MTRNKPNISYIRILGSLAYILDPKEIRDKSSLGKLANKANKGILIGHRSSKNFIIYLPSTNQIVDSSSFVIKEDLKYQDDFIVQEDYSNLLEPESTEYDYIKSNINITESGLSSKTRPVVEIPYYRPTPEPIEPEERIILGSEEPEEPVISGPEEPEISRRSARLRHQTPDNKGLSVYNLASVALLAALNKGEDNDFDQPNLLKLELSALETKGSEKSTILFNEPKSYKEAISSVYKEKWLESMKIEYNKLNNNNTWELVPLPQGARVLKTRWVYKLKNPKNSLDLDSEEVEFKSRFVAKGFEQLYGLDYLETYAAVIKQMAWKLVFAIAILNNWLIYKIDMISAFTQGDIDSYIYIYQPEGFISSDRPDHVLKLRKALYGLKQSARIWYYTLKEKLVSKLGFSVL